MAGVTRLFFVVWTYCLTTATAGEVPKCYTEGQGVTFHCVVPRLTGILEWDGVGFDCVDADNTFGSNLLPLLTSEDPSHCTEERGLCGPYSGSLSCLGNGSVISDLSFIARYSMNGGFIECAFRYDVIETILLQVGVVPDPPASVNFTFPSGTEFRSEWAPPQEHVVGGIKGYNVTANGNCGTCDPIGMVNNTTFISSCTGWIPTNQSCQIEIRTVTADCGFMSEPAKGITTAVPTDVQVSLVCSQSPDFPDYHVEWKYDHPKVANTLIFPQELGVELIFSDRIGGSYSLFLPNSSARSLDLSSPEVEAFKLSNDTKKRNVTVVVMTEAGNFTSIPFTFSAEGTRTNPSPALNESQCIEVSISSFCRETAKSFLARLQYMEEKNDTTLETGLIGRTFYGLDESYTTCIPVVERERKVYYSAQVYYDGVEVGKTKTQELILSSCNTNSLNIQGEVAIFSIPEGVVNLGDEVAHNSALRFTCMMSCDLIGQNQTRCVNGTFESNLTSAPSIQCICSQEGGVSTTLFNVLFNIIAYGVVLPSLISLQILIMVCWLKKRRIKRNLSRKPRKIQSGMSFSNEEDHYSTITMDSATESKVDSLY